MVRVPRQACRSHCVQTIWLTTKVSLMCQNPHRPLVVVGYNTYASVLPHLQGSQQICFMHKQWWRFLLCFVRYLEILLGKKGLSLSSRFPCSHMNLTVSEPRRQTWRTRNLSFLTQAGEIQSSNITWITTLDDVTWFTFLLYPWKT